MLGSGRSSSRVCDSAPVQHSGHRTARGTQDTQGLLRGSSGDTQGVLRGYSGGTHVCRRPRGGPARRGRSCCHSGTHELPGSLSGCAGDIWCTADPQGLICKIPAGRLQGEGHRSEGCAWMRIIPQLSRSHQHKVQLCSHVVHSKPAFLPGTWASPLQLLIRKLGSVEASIPPTALSVILTSVPHCFTSKLGCLCCSGAACKSPGILAPVPAVQHCLPSGQRALQGSNRGSTGKLLATTPKYHLQGKFTTQSSLHGGCHKHWLCPGSQKHLCGKFQKLNFPHLEHGTCPSARPWGAATQSNKFSYTKGQGKNLSCCIVQQKCTARLLPSLWRQRDIQAK